MFHCNGFITGIIGGVVGACALAFVIGGLMPHVLYKRVGIALPFVLEFTTDKGSKFYTYAHLTSKKDKRARLTIPPFAFKTIAGISSVSSSVMLGGKIPLQLVPLAESPTQHVAMYPADKVGAAQINQSGVVTITAPTISGVGDPWGVSQEVCLEFPIA